MAKSEQFQEVLSLGKTLVDIFSEGDRTDLTTSWMAHYLAEVMQEANDEKDVKKKRALQKECSDIILELWEKRNRFPQNVAPLAGLTHAVAIIKALNDKESDDLYWRRFQRVEDDSVWGAYIYSLRNAVEDSLKITLSATVAKQVLEREKKWKEHGAFLSDQEKEIIDFLDRQLLTNDHQITIIYNHLSKIDKSKETKAKKVKKEPERMEKVFVKLRELLNKQEAALEKLEKQVLKPKMTKRKASKSKVT